MNLHSGVDLIEIERIQTAIARHGERFLHRIYTSRELNQCGGKAESLAVRFAAKEAAAKALGCGFGEIAWDEVEIQTDARGAPQLRLYRKAAILAEKKGIKTWTLSLSHSRTHAIAVVFGIGL
jgi:holo-[acyl-carrier protein] synthase